jgi:hypothetical protein
MNKFKISLIATMLFAFTMGLKADEFRVISFERDESDLAAVRYSRKDINDDHCALLKIQTDLTGLSFESNLGISGDVVQKPGEYWIYLSPREKRIRIMKEGFIPYNYTFDELIEPSTVYVMVLTSGVQEEDIQHTGFVQITSFPDDATVYINDEIKGKTPYQLEMQQGLYQLRLMKDTYKPFETDFAIFADSTSALTIALESAIGQVVINSLPEQGAEIIMDGVSLEAKTPYTFDQLDPGNHSITLLKQFYNPTTYEFEIDTGESKTINVELEPAFALVTILAPEAQIFIDEQYMGIGKFTGRLQSGYHTVEAKRHNYYPEKKDIEVLPGVDQTVNIDFRPISGSLSLITDPPGAEIVINGTIYGYTPKVIRELIIGDYEVSLSLNDYEAVTKNITISEGSNIKLDEKLVAITAIPIIVDDDQEVITQEDENLQEDEEIKPEEEPVIQPPVEETNQDDIQIDDKPQYDSEKLSKHFYIRPVCAYAIDPFNNRPDIMAYSVTQTGENTYNFKTEKVSLSKGLHAGLAAGGYFTDWLGAEFQFTYLLSQENSVTDAYSYFEDEWSYTYTMKSKLMRFALSMVLYKNFNTIGVYFTPGILVTSPKITYSRLYNDRYLVYDYYEEIEEFEEWEYSGGTAIGFTGGIGMNINVSESFGIFLEARTDILNFAPDNGYRNEYRFIINGEQQPVDDPKYFTEIEFVDSYSESLDPDYDAPQKQLKRSYSFSSIQAAFGVIIKLF